MISKQSMLACMLYCLCFIACHESPPYVDVYQSLQMSDNTADMGLSDSGLDMMSQPDQMVANTCDAEGPVKVYAVYQMNFASVVDGVTAGFNVDQATSMIGDTQGCGHADFVDPEGYMGIDNQFSAVIPLLNPFLAQPLNEALTRTIQEKAFIILIELQGVDHELNDDCVKVNLFRAQPQALVGNDGLLLEGQSYEIDLDLPWAHSDQAYIQDGRLYTLPFELSLPITFSEISLSLFLSTTLLTFDLSQNDQQERHGVLGGALSLESLVDSVAGISEEIAPLARQLVAGKADLDPDDSGSCQSISIAWQLKVHQAHLYVDTTRPDQSSK